VSHAVFGHMLAHMILRGLMYGMIFKLLRHLTLPETVALVAVVVGIFWFVGKSGRLRSPWA
jgi:glucose uptake protein GlcU